MANEIRPGCDRIRGMAPEKHQRVMNAAMEEFSKGYRIASTDAIAHAAGVSKGLLFHYFGTKQGLFQYVAQYALEMVSGEYMDLLNTRQRDLLDRIWQLTLLKRELCMKYPAIFEFLTAVYYEMQSEPNSVFSVKFRQIQKAVYEMPDGDTVSALMREGVDTRMAANIVRWALEGFSKEIADSQQSFSKLLEQYDDHLARTKQYLDLLRFLLYRDGEPLRKGGPD